MLLWAESFSYFGGNKSKMLDGLWAQVDASMSLSATRARTGTHSLKMQANNFGFSQDEARRVFGGAKTTVGLGFASYLEALPSVNDTYGIQFRDTANQGQLTAFIQSTGIIEVKRGNFGGGYTSLGATDRPVVTANGWHHLEMMPVAGNATGGAFELRVNEVTRLNLTGIDTIFTSNAEYSQFAIGDGSNSPTNADWFISDMYAWDDQVAPNNTIVDFIGDKKVFTSWVDGDTAVADFLKSSGITGYALLDEASPDDADYIYTDTDGDVSEFNFSDPPGEVVEVIGVVPIPRLCKSDAGTVFHAADLVHDGDATAADAIPATTQATYWPFPFTINPSTGVPFTPSELAATKLRLTRAAA